MIFKCSMWKKNIQCPIYFLKNWMKISVIATAAQLYCYTSIRIILIIHDSSLSIFICHSSFCYLHFAFDQTSETIIYSSMGIKQTQRSTYTKYENSIHLKSEWIHSNQCVTCNYFIINNMKIIIMNLNKFWKRIKNGKIEISVLF